MKLNRLIKSILNTAVYIIDQTADQVDRVSDRASAMADDAREVIAPREDHTLRNILSFAAGIGVGVGAGLLLAPASGADIRNSITDKVQDISNRVKRGGDAYATGSDVR
jgi:hypothetical protein